ncbi:hypothetical protein D3C84_404420 [compost metagenome]
MFIEGDDGVVAGAFGDQPHAFFTQAQLFLGRATLGDFDEGQHRAVDVVFAGAIRQQAGNVPAVVGAADFALDHVQRFENQGGIGGQVLVVQAMGDVEQ